MVVVSEPNEVLSVVKPLPSTNFKQHAQSFYQGRDDAFAYELRQVHPDEIELDLDTQSRHKENQELIDDWAKLMSGGEWDVECSHPYHELPELVLGEEGKYYPLSHHRIKAAIASQTTLLYKVWLPNGLPTLPFARILAAASNPQKGQPWSSKDHKKRVFQLLDSWSAMSREEHELFLVGVPIGGEQLTRIKNSHQLSSYAIASILDLPQRTVANYKKEWDNIKQVAQSGLKVGDRVKVAQSLDWVEIGETGVIAEIDSKKASIWVKWDARPKEPPFPTPLGKLVESDAPAPCLLHASEVVDLLVALDNDQWNKDKLAGHQRIDVGEYRAIKSSFNNGYWLVTPDDEALHSLLEEIKQTRLCFASLQQQAPTTSVLPDVKPEQEDARHPDVATDYDMQTGTTPEQYAAAEALLGAIAPLPYEEGEVVLVRFEREFGAIAGLKSVGIVRKVEKLGCIVFFAYYQVEHSISAPFLTKVDEQRQAEVKAVHDRIGALCKCTLERVDLAALEQMAREVEYSERTLKVLEGIERYYLGTEIGRVLKMRLDN